MDDKICPRCKTTKYRNPLLKLFVNTCGHPLCENCVDLLFVRGSGVCPQCNVALRRTNFREQLFEDAFIEKETEIRKKILRDYNKREEDFTNLGDYNNYLEEVEAIIFNLSNNIDVEATKQKIEVYKTANQEVIRKNRKKVSKEEAFLSDLIEQERLEREAHYKANKEELQNEQVANKRRKEALIDELMFSDLPADHILEQHRHEVEKETQKQQAEHSRTGVFSTGIKIGGHSSHIVMPTAEDSGEPYLHEKTEQEWLGPKPPKDDELDELGYLSHIRKASSKEMAGGFTENLACSRAIQEAFSGLLFAAQRDLFQSGRVDLS